MIKQLAHLCLHTPDLEKTAHFWCDTLGLEKQFDFVRQGDPFGYYVKLGNTTFVEVFQLAGDADPAPPGNINHLAIEVDDIDAVIAAVRAGGYDCTDRKLGADHSWQAWTADPNGVRIEFHQYTDESLQRVGGTCHATW
jgi:catechol 2,3-dioxygenase-like lactoylglutathione lyase family enzyme